MAARCIGHVEPHASGTHEPRKPEAEQRVTLRFERACATSSPCTSRCTPGDDMRLTRCRSRAASVGSCSAPTGARASKLAISRLQPVADAGFPRLTAGRRVQIVKERYRRVNPERCFTRLSPRRLLSHPDLGALTSRQTAHPSHRRVPGYVPLAFLRHSFGPVTAGRCGVVSLLRCPLPGRSPCQGAIGVADTLHSGIPAQR